MTERNPHDLLNQLEDILNSDPLIDEVGFIHPSQFITLNEEAGALPSSVGTILHSEDAVLRSGASKVNPSATVFWCRDHKLGISTQVLLALYNAAKHAFMSALERYKTYMTLSVKKDTSGGNDTPSCFSSSLDILESEVMKCSRTLLLLSCDFGTAWNSRKQVLSTKQNFQIFVDELFLSALVLSYAPKSECSWSHRRWVIKMIAGKCSNLQEIVEKESELVKKLAEKSKMNYRAWNHRCWLVSYMSKGQVLNELNKSRDWTRLHIADSSCFHYRTRLMLRMLEESWHKQNPIASCSHNAELRQLWKEELDWNEMLIKSYIGREASTMASSPLPLPCLDKALCD
ncbi:Protein prenyltransferase alpha subunit repeat-containing protein [Actinidia chinensis var. chinensis]|uniref:Protein prenyltransferase alpha subunit repeat-containing protein n=1 Tax=Actinidia chinensis var. chinensis TaxID=1590841 RepID=A0A2R6QAU2_ACTCC|nr:Protein prenyltransferase alpha subunit repeat-containing protein [Actinidia chinensis var. chinensis]